MQASAERTLSPAEIPPFLDALEARIAAAYGFQWSDLPSGGLALWLLSANGVVAKIILRDDLADEFRSHEGIRCAIIDVIAERPTKNLDGQEKTFEVVQIGR